MYRKNVAGQKLGFRLVNASTGAALTGATVTVYRSVNGGAQTAAAGTVAELGNGQYSLTLDAADVNGDQISFLFVATSAVVEEKTILCTAADPTNATSYGLANLDAAVSSRIASLGANAPANWLNAAAIAASALNGKGDWLTAGAYAAPPSSAANAQAVWDLPQSSIGPGATQGQLLAAIADYPDPWIAEAATVLSPVPTTTTFRIDRTDLKGSIATPCLCALNANALRGAIVRVASYDPATGDVVLVDPLPVAPPSNVSCTVQFSGSLPVRLDLAQPITDARTATVGGALAGSWAVAWGKTVRDRVAKLLKVWGPTNASATPSATFALDDADAPTSRTPSS